MKSDFPYNAPENTVLIPKIFSGFPIVHSGMSTKLGNSAQSRFGMNLSFLVGDDPALVEMNRAAFFSHLGISGKELAIPVQSHSKNVRRIDAPGEYDTCDALITNKSGVALGITVADCVPILLYDPIQNAIGAIHAGWKGTALAIAECTLRSMKDEFNTDAAHVFAFIGPSAGVCCYEVGEEVAVKFENKIVPYNTKKIFIDLKKENLVQLKKVGVIAENIEVSEHCTICEKQFFHSYRRDRTSAGRMMAVISMKS